MDMINNSRTPALSNVGDEIMLHISPSGFLRLDGNTPTALMFDLTSVTPNRYDSSHISPLHGRAVFHCFADLSSGLCDAVLK